MTAAVQRTLSGDMGERLVFIAELMPDGERPDTDKQPLARQELETLRRIAYMLAQAMAATAQSMEAQIGLVGLTNSVAALQFSLNGYSASKSLSVQAKEIRENTRDVQTQIRAVQATTSSNPLLQQVLASSLLQLKDLEPKGKEGSRVVRLVTLRGDKIATALADVKGALASKATGATIVPMNAKASDGVTAAITAIRGKTATTTSATVTDLAQAKVVLSGAVTADSKIPTTTQTVGPVASAAKAISVNAATATNVTENRAAPITAGTSITNINAGIGKGVPVLTAPHVTPTGIKNDTASIVLTGATTQARMERPHQVQGDKIVLTVKGEPSDLVRSEVISVTRSETTVASQAAPAAASRSEVRTQGPDVKTVSVESVAAKTVIDASATNKVEPIAKADIRNTGGVEPVRTEPPRTETPRAEAFKTETPRPEARTETPRTTEAPRAEASRAETLRTEAPRAEVRVETPKAVEPQRQPEAPRTETPKFDAFRAETSKVDVPRAEVKTDTSKTADAPRTEAPRPEIRTETPRAAEPQRQQETPRAEAPKSDTPRSETSRTAESQRQPEKSRDADVRTEFRQQEQHQCGAGCAIHGGGRATVAADETRKNGIGDAFRSAPIAETQSSSTPPPSAQNRTFTTDVRAEFKQQEQHQCGAGCAIHGGGRATVTADETRKNGIGDAFNFNAEKPSPPKADPKQTIYTETLNA